MSTEELERDEVRGGLTGKRGRASGDERSCVERARDAPVTPVTPVYQEEVQSFEDLLAEMKLEEQKRR